MSAADVPLSAALASALADEVGGAAVAASRLADALAGDGEILRRHMSVLQEIDRITQVLHAIADVLRPGRPLDARLEAIPLECVAARLVDAGPRGAGASFPAV